MPRTRKLGLGAQIRKKRSKVLTKKLSTARAKRPGSQEDDFKLKRGKFVFGPDTTTKTRKKKVSGLAAQRKSRKRK